MINAFCRSHFSYNEKRNLFFSQHPRTCPHCHLPKIKRRLNLNNFTRVHRAPPAPSPTAGGPGAGGAGHGGAGHGGHGGAAPNFVTMAQFTIFSNMVTNSLNQLNANINNLTAIVNNLTANFNNLSNNVNNLTATVNNLSNDVNQKINRINNRLGLH